MKSHIIVRSCVAGTALLLTVSSCASSAANDALKKAGVQVTAGGKLPAAFPPDVPTPSLTLETGVGTAGLFTLRYTSKDAKADVAAYRKTLEAAGFAITGDFDNLAAKANVGFICLKGTMNVDVSAFGPDTPGGGNYLAVIVTTV